MTKRFSPLLLNPVCSGVIRTEDSQGRGGPGPSALSHKAASRSGGSVWTPPFRAGSGRKAGPGCRPIPAPRRPSPARRYATGSWESATAGVFIPWDSANTANRGFCVLGSWFSSTPLRRAHANWELRGFRNHRGSCGHGGGNRSHSLSHL